MIADHVAKLGAELERAWAAEGHDDTRFSGLATEVLSEHPPPPDLDAMSLLRHATGTDALPQQEDPDGGFGQPPITLHRSRDFFISALIWLEGTTTIHEHGFSGAFQVLDGTSLHVRHAFTPTDRINRRLALGELTAGSPEVLRRGSVRPIVAGATGAHSLFHLEHPSATLVVRTYREPWSQPQLNYYRPGLAIDPFYVDRSLDRRIQALGALRGIDSHAAVVSARGLLAALDPYSGIRVLDDWFRQGDRGELFAALLDRFIARHGSRFGVLRAVYEERGREKALMTRRGLLHDPRHRLLLALLVNLPDWPSQRRVCADLFPTEDPGDLIATLLEELSTPALRGRSGLSLAAEEVVAVRRALTCGDDESAVDQLRQLSLQPRAPDVWQRLIG